MSNSISTNFLRLYAYILVLPFFVHVGSGGVGFGERVFSEYRTPGIDLPLSFFVLCFIVLGWATFNLPLLLRHVVNLPVTIKLYILFCSLSYSYGLFNGLFVDSNYQYALSFSFFLQTIIPVFSFVVAIELCRHCDVNELIFFLKKLVFIWIFLISVVLFSQCIQTVLDFGGGYLFQSGLVDYVGGINITKIKRYYPFVVGCCSVFLLMRAFFSPGRGLFFVGLYLFFTMMIPLIWSRSAVVFSVLALLFMLALVLYEGGLPRSRVRLLWGLFFSLFGVVFVLFAFEAKVITRFYEMFSSDFGAAQSDNIRVGAIASAIVDGVSTPFGLAFSAGMSETLGGFSYEFSRVSVAEVTYLEVLSKAGLLPFVMIVIFSIDTLCKGYRLLVFWRFKECRWVVYSLVCVIYLALIFSNFTQQNFTEPYASLFLFFLFGVQSVFVRKL